ncbi:hypothetical protein OIU78_011844 [Salix suchowensis]|nr:hypothetical protein OIU78_011844 [Salix suchowensis]
MKGSKICSFLFLNEEGKKSSAADQRMAIELAARYECSAEAGKLAARHRPVNQYNPFYSVSIYFLHIATDSKKDPSEEGLAGPVLDRVGVVLIIDGLVDFLENQVKNVRNEVERQEAELAKLWEQIDGEMAAAKDLHDQEMAVAAARHAQEMAAAKDLHDQEMAAAAARHAQEMAAVKREYNLKHLVMLLYLFIFIFFLLKNMALRLMNLLCSLTHAQY